MFMQNNRNDLKVKRAFNGIWRDWLCSLICCDCFLFAKVRKSKDNKNLSSGKTHTFLSGDNR